MGTEHLPIEELQRLLSDVAEHGTQHLLEVEADLKQTTYLLSEAISKLSAGFMRIHESVAAQQQAVDAALKERVAAEKVKPQAPAAETPAASEVLACREQIAREIDAVVVGLQFQDLTSQLIARTLKRVDGLREVLAALTHHGEAMPAAHEHEAMAQLLCRINQSLSSQSSALQDGLRQEVSQKHMESGEIELF